MIPQDYKNVILWIKGLPMPLLIQLIDEASAELAKRIRPDRAPAPKDSDKD